jgi:hypothetical protein
MSVAETANLIVRLGLKDELAPALAKDAQALHGIEAGANRAAGGLNRLGGVAGRAGGAFGHLRGHMSGLLGAAGIFGAAGIGLGVEHFLHGAIEEATTFGATVTRMKAITGESADSIVGLTGVLSYFGIAADKQTKVVGMMTKNIGAITLTAASAAKFQKEYGVELLDSSGKVKAMSDVIVEASDYFNDKNIPATQKAAAMAKLFGRSWQDLIPVLSAGSAELERINEHERKLNPINEQNLRDMKDLKVAQRDWNSAMETMKVQVGLTLLPLLKDLARAASDFLSDPGNRATIIGFFKQGVQFARDFAGYIGQTVIPVVSGLASTAKQFWDAIPGPLRDLMVKGFVANQTIKFLFGFDVAGVAKNFIGDAIGVVARNIFGRGASPAMPLYVSGAIGGGGAGAAGAGGSGIMRTLGTIGAVTIAASSIIALAETFKGFMDSNAQAQKDLADKAAAAIKQSGREAAVNIGKLTNTLTHQGMFESLVTNTWGSKETGQALINLSHAITQDGSLSRSEIVSSIEQLKAAQAAAAGRGWTEAAAAIGADILTLGEKLPTAPEIGTAVATKVDEVVKPPEPEAVKVKPSAAAVGRMSRHDVEALTTRLDTIGRNARTTGTNVTRGTTALSVKADALRAQVASLRAAMTVASARQSVLLAGILAKRTTLNAYTNVNVSTYVSSRDVTYRQNISSRYGASTT